MENLWPLVREVRNAECGARNGLANGGRERAANSICNFQLCTARLHRPRPACVPGLSPVLLPAVRRTGEPPAPLPDPAVSGWLSVLLRCCYGAATVILRYCSDVGRATC